MLTLPVAIRCDRQQALAIRGAEDDADSLGHADRIAWAHTIVNLSNASVH
jgi:hypothetical protein